MRTGRWVRVEDRIAAVVAAGLVLGLAGCGGGGNGTNLADDLSAAPGDLESAATAPDLAPPVDAAPAIDGADPVDLTEASCDGGLLACSGACVDTRVDVANCGACGSACPNGDRCRAGACQLCMLPGTQPDIQVPVSRTPIHVAAVDLDRDKLLDLLALDPDGGRLEVLRNQGPRGFAAADTYDVGGTPVDLAVGDVTGDGKPDAVVLELLSGAIEVFRGNGDGTFGAHTDYPGPGGSVVEQALLDLDGDGHLDVVVADASGNLGVYLSRNGVLVAQASTQIPIYPVSLYPTDVNRDRHADLVLVWADGLNQSHTRLFESDGKGGLTDKGDVTAVNVWGYPVDLDRDGKIDLVSGAIDVQKNGSVVVQLGKGDGTFGPASTYPTSAWGPTVYLGDIDGDGDLDVVWQDSAKTTNYFPNQGDGHLGKSRSLGNQVGAAIELVTDLNGDGADDFVLGFNGYIDLLETRCR